MCAPLEPSPASSRTTSPAGSLVPLPPTSSGVVTPPLGPLEFASQLSVSMFLSLPVEIKRLIPPLLERPDQYALVRVHSAWRDVVEEALWSTLSIDPRPKTSAGAAARKSTFRRVHAEGAKDWTFGFGDAQHPVEAVDLLLAEEWEVALQMLTLRPMRKRYVRRLGAACSGRAARAMDKLLEDLAPSLGALQLTTLCCYYAKCTNTLPSLERLSAIPSWPSLTDLQFCVAITPGWFNHLITVLRRTPQLTSLAIETGSQCRDDVVNDCRWPVPECADLDLPHLVHLTVDSFRWRGIARRLLSRAPKLHFMAVRYGDVPFDHTVYGFGDPDPDLDDDQQAHWDLRNEGVPRPGKMERVLGQHAELRHLIVHDHQANRGFPVTDATKTSWLPHLESLVLFDKTGAGPGVVPPHPAVKSVAILPTHSFTHATRAWQSIGALPSDQVAGLIYPPAIDSIRRCPQMTIMCLPGAWKAMSSRWHLDPGSGTLNIRSFGNGEDELYHCRLKLVHPSANLWDRHEKAYTSIERRFWERYRKEHQGWGRGSRVGALAGRGTIDDIGIVVDLVSYRRRPVPMALLKHVYVLSGLDWEWITGERDGELADEAWALLAAWVKELDYIVSHG